MQLIDLIQDKKPSLSFEVFPPKTWDTFDQVSSAAFRIAELSPSYMSVTYGAGGGTSDYTLAIAKTLEQQYGVPTVAHLSCVASTKEEIRQKLSALHEAEIHNILALRGDMPKDMTRDHLDYHYASELIREIREFGGFCISGACYPEGHPESPNFAEDIRHLKEKVDAGCDFLTTQMFFDNNILYNFLYRLREAGVSVPVVAGIMPVTNPKQIRRICSISGTALPQRFIRIVDRYGNDPEAMKQAGIAYATEQIIDLFANGIGAVHVYSMNNPEVAAKIQANLSAILR